MTQININLREISGLVPETANLTNARIDFSPYAAYADADGWVTRNILHVKAPLGVATPDVPPTPTGNAYEVQERGFRGARHGYVLVPDQDTVDYVDLVWVDKDTLDPVVAPSPAWVAEAAALEAGVTSAQDAADAAQTDATAALTGLGSKVDTSTYTTGLAAKADQTALTAEASTRATADTANANAISAEATARADAITAEASARGTAIAAEATARADADALLAPKANPTFTGTVTGVTKTHVGLGNVDNTSDVNKPVSTAQATADALRVEKPTGPMQFVIYGASQSVDPGLRCTSGSEWFKQVATELGTTATTYAYSGRRTSDMAGYALSGTTPVTGQGAHPSGASATWSGMDTVGKVPVIDTSMNDIGHYPSMVPSPVVPALISGAAGTRYVAGMGGALRCLLATMISQSRVENGSATSSGVWSNAAIGSGGSTSYTSAVGATRTYTVTPPQGGEFAGEVWHVGTTLSTESAATSSAFTYSIDGGAESATVTPPGWQRYVGWGGANIDSTPFVTKITLPVDGASHTVRITHAGTAGHFLYSDCILVPSEKPLPILVLAAPRQVKVATGVFDATGVATYARNWRVIEDQQKAIVAEFPNAVYVPCNFSTNGLSNTDGLHANDRGMEQRKNDVLSAIFNNAQLRAALLANKSRAASDANYATL